jgi:hypothetical protein
MTVLNSVHTHSNEKDITGYRLGDVLIWQCLLELAAYLCQILRKLTFAVFWMRTIGARWLYAYSAWMAPSLLNNWY